jgi:hypothetical protein
LKNDKVSFGLYGQLTTARDCMIKPFIKKILSDRQRVNLRAFFAKNDLNRLAQLYGTDKFGVHRYTRRIICAISLT